MAELKLNQNSASFAEKGLEESSKISSNLTATEEGKPGPTIPVEIKQILETIHEVRTNIESSRLKVRSNESSTFSSRCKNESSAGCSQHNDNVEISKEGKVLSIQQRNMEKFAKLKERIQQKVDSGVLTKVTIVDVVSCQDQASKRIGNTLRLVKNVIDDQKKGTENNKREKIIQFLAKVEEDVKLGKLKQVKPEKMPFLFEQRLNKPSGKVLILETVSDKRISNNPKVVKSQAHQSTEKVEKDFELAKDVKLMKVETNHMKSSTSIEKSLERRMLSSLNSKESEEGPDKEKNADGAVGHEFEDLKIKCKHKRSNSQKSLGSDKHQHGEGKLNLKINKHSCNSEEETGIAGASNLNSNSASQIVEPFSKEVEKSTEEDEMKREPMMEEVEDDWIGESSNANEDLTVDHENCEEDEEIIIITEASDADDECSSEVDDIEVFEDDEDSDVVADAVEDTEECVEEAESEEEVESDVYCKNLRPPFFYPRLKTIEENWVEEEYMEETTESDSCEDVNEELEVELNSNEDEVKDDCNLNRDNVTMEHFDAVQQLQTQRSIGTIKMNVTSTESEEFETLDELHSSKRGTKYYTNGKNVEILQETELRLSKCKEDNNLNPLPKSRMSEILLKDCDKVHRSSVMRNNLIFDRMKSNEPIILSKLFTELASIREHKTINRNKGSTSCKAEKADVKPGAPTANEVAEFPNEEECSGPKMCNERLLTASDSVVNSWDLDLKRKKEKIQVNPRNSELNLQGSSSEELKPLDKANALSRCELGKNAVEHTPTRNTDPIALNKKFDESMKEFERKLKEIFGSKDSKQGAVSKCSTRIMPAASAPLEEQQCGNAALESSQSVSPTGNTALSGQNIEVKVEDSRNPIQWAYNEKSGNDLISNKLGYDSSEELECDGVNKFKDETKSQSYENEKIKTTSVNILPVNSKTAEDVGVEQIVNSSMSSKNRYEMLKVALKKSSIDFMDPLLGADAFPGTMSGSGMAAVAEVGQEFTEIVEVDEVEEILLSSDEEQHFDFSTMCAALNPHSAEQNIKQVNDKVSIKKFDEGCNSATSWTNEVVRSQAMNDSNLQAVDQSNTLLNSMPTSSKASVGLENNLKDTESTEKSEQMPTKNEEVKKVSRFKVRPISPPRDNANEPPRLMRLTISKKESKSNGSQVSSGAESHTRKFKRLKIDLESDSEKFVWDFCPENVCSFNQYVSKRYKLRVMPPKLEAIEEVDEPETVTDPESDPDADTNTDTDLETVDGNFSISDADSVDYDAYFNLSDLSGDDISDILSGVCFVGQLDTHSLGVFLILPLCIYLSIGALFLLAGFVSLFRIRTVMKTDGKRTDKLERLMMRIGFFSGLFILPALGFLGCLFYEYYFLDEWMVQWHRDICKPFSIPCPLMRNDGSEPRPIFQIYMVKYLCSMLVGVTSSVWLYSSKTMVSWRNFVERLQGKDPRTRAQAYV